MMELKSVAPDLSKVTYQSGKVQTTVAEQVPELVARVFPNEATVSEIVSWRLGPHRQMMNFFGWVNNSSPHQKPNSFQGVTQSAYPTCALSISKLVANTPVTVHY